MADNDFKLTNLLSGFNSKKFNKEKQNSIDRSADEIAAARYMFRTREGSKLLVPVHTWEESGIAQSKPIDPENEADAEFMKTLTGVNVIPGENKLVVYADTNPKLKHILTHQDRYGDIPTRLAIEKSGMSGSREVFDVEFRQSSEFDYPKAMISLDPESTKLDELYSDLGFPRAMIAEKDENNNQKETKIDRKKKVSALQDPSLNLQGEYVNAVSNIVSKSLLDLVALYKIVAFDDGEVPRDAALSHMGNVIDATTAMQMDDILLAMDHVTQNFNIEDSNFPFEMQTIGPEIREYPRAGTLAKAKQNAIKALPGITEVRPLGSDLYLVFTKLAEDSSLTEAGHNLTYKLFDPSVKDKRAAIDNALKYVQNEIDTNIISLLPEEHADMRAPLGRVTSGIIIDIGRRAYEILAVNGDLQAYMDTQYMNMRADLTSYGWKFGWKKNAELPRNNHWKRPYANKSSMESKPSDAALPTSITNSGNGNGE